MPRCGRIVTSARPGSTPEQHLLEQMGVSVQPLTGGCGLAGSWGFEKGKYDISLDCGEQALLPAVRNAEKDTLIVAAGFSCKTQIEQAGTGRGALHRRPRRHAPPPPVGTSPPARRRWGDVMDAPKTQPWHGAARVIARTRPAPGHPPASNRSTSAGGL